MTMIEEHPGWRLRSPLCTCLPDWSGRCAYHEFDGIHSTTGGDAEAVSNALSIYMERLALDPENDALRDSCARVLEPVLDAYLWHLAENARDPEGGEDLYTLADIREFLKEVRT